MNHITTPKSASPTQIKVGNLLLSKFRRRNKKKSNSAIFSVVVFDGENAEQSVTAPVFFKMPGSIIGMSLRKMVFPLFATDEYLLIDISGPSSSKSECFPAATESLLSLPVPRSLQKRPTAEVLGDLIPHRRRGLGSQQRVAVSQPKSRFVSTEVSFDPDRLVRLIPTLSTISLLRLWQNALRYLTEGTAGDAHQAATLRVIVAIEFAWSSRQFEQDLGDQVFAWPTTDAPKRKGASLACFEAGEEGMLSYLEYRVGKTNGQPRKVRHAILDRVFSGSLPAVFPKQYMDQWGEPKTAVRLRKMAESIAAFARNLKRREDDRMQQAIDSWEGDLEYLFEAYYVGHFRFAWPITRTN